MSNGEVCAFVFQREYHKKWILYTDEEMEIFNNAIRDQKKLVPLQNKNLKKQLVIDLEKMIQKNQVSLYEQRIRCLVPNSGFYLWLWQDENDEWCCYKPYLVFLLEVAYSRKEKSFKFYDNGDFCVNFDTFDQLNESTSKLYPVKRENIKLSVTAEMKNISLQNEALFKKLSAIKDQDGKRVHLDIPRGNGVNTPSTSSDPINTDIPKFSDMKRPSTSDSLKTVPVDSECPARENYHMYHEDNVTFSATLNQTNLQNNNNKFYLIQLLEHNKMKQYAVWRRWGRVGHRGQTDFSTYGTSLPEAKKSFETKFRDKTRNDWSDIKSFVHVRGKYDLLDMDLNPEPEQEVKKIKLDVVSKLAIRIQALMEIICDQKRMEDMMKEMSYDSKKTPLGKLTLKQVQDGYIALNKISTILSTKGKGSDLLNACNDFYTKIPHSFGMKTPPIIGTQSDIDDKLKMLEALSNITVAMGVLNATSDKIEHPLDKYYASLNCILETLNPEDAEYIELEKCLIGTHGVTHAGYEMEIMDAFKCCKSQEESSFMKLENRMLLWHGSRITNWLGILKQGLRIAPPEAPVTGYMFGKGIYFADASSKSANYCCASRKKNEGILLLCEVAVGNQYPLTESEFNLPAVLPSGYNSVLGKGRRNPQEFKISALSSEAKAPFGPLVENDSYQGALQYNEYIVYDVKQVKMRYLSRIRFNYK